MRRKTLTPTAKALIVRRALDTLSDTGAVPAALAHRARQLVTADFCDHSRAGMAVPALVSHALIEARRA